MPVSGLVVTLSEDPAERGTAEKALGAEPGVALGQPFGRRLPVVIEATAVEEHDGLIERIEDLSGVGFVELVFTDFSDVESVQRLPRRRRRARSPEV